MAQVEVEGLVLKHVNFQDSDRIVTLFTREKGIVSGRARGVRKSARRFGGRLDLFTRVTLKIGRRGRGFDGADLLDAYLGVREDLGRFAWASSISELALRLFGEDEPHPAAYDLLLQAMSHLHKSEAIRPGYLYILELLLLREAGLLPQLGACLSCQAPVGSSIDGSLRAFSFVIASGGVVCRPCQGITPLPTIGLGALRGLERGLVLGAEEAKRLKFLASTELEIRRLMGDFLRYHVGGRFTARRFLEDTWDAF